MSDKPKMMLKYKYAYRELDSLFTRLSKKEMYFILKNYYDHLDETGYRPTFKV